METIVPAGEPSLPVELLQPGLQPPQDLPGLSPSESGQFHVPQRTGLAGRLMGWT